MPWGYHCKHLSDGTSGGGGIGPVASLAPCEGTGNLAVQLWPIPADTCCWCSEPGISPCWLLAKRQHVWLSSRRGGKPSLYADRLEHFHKIGQGLGASTQPSCDLPIQDTLVECRCSRHPYQKTRHIYNNEVHTTYRPLLLPVPGHAWHWAYALHRLTHKEYALHGFKYKQVLANPCAQRNNDLMDAGAAPWRPVPRGGSARGSGRTWAGHCWRCRCFCRQLQRWRCRG